MPYEFEGCVYKYVGYYDEKKDPDVYPHIYVWASKLFTNGLSGGIIVVKRQTHMSILKQKIAGMTLLVMKPQVEKQLVELLVLETNNV